MIDYYKQLLDLEIDKYYFQIVAYHLDVSPIKIMFLVFYVITVLIHLYIYCYSAEQLLTEVK